MYTYTLRITKILIRTKAIVSLRQLFPNWSLATTVSTTDYIPCSISELTLDPVEVRAKLSGSMDFTYEQDLIEEDDSFFNSKEYLEAKDWYFNLSKEDQDKVNLLIRGSMPRA